MNRYQKLRIEYDKGGEFRKYVNRVSHSRELPVDDVLKLLITYEYYLSLQHGGCNEEKQGKTV